MPSAIDRKVTGLKSALGFKVGVKRVRLYLKGWHPNGPKNGATAAAGKFCLLKIACMKQDSRKMTKGFVLNPDLSGDTVAEGLSDYFSFLEDIQVF